jgi:hypothetical protein
VKPIELDQLAAHRPGRIWVTRADQSVVVVDGPRMFNDRLVGFVDGKYQMIPTDDVKHMSWRQPATGRTAALVAAGVASAVAVAFMISGRDPYRDPCSTGSSDCLPDEP